MVTSGERAARPLAGAHRRASRSGKVKKIERGPGSTAIVTMAIEKKGLPLHKDATAQDPAAHLPRGQLLRRPQPGTPRRRRGRRATRSRWRRPPSPVQLDQILSTLQTDTRAQLKKLARRARRLVRPAAAPRGSSAPSRTGRRRSRRWRRRAEARAARAPDDLSAASCRAAAAMAAAVRPRPARAGRADHRAQPHGRARSRAKRDELERSLPGARRAAARGGPGAARDRRRASRPRARSATRGAPGAARGARDAAARAAAAARSCAAWCSPRELPALLGAARPGDARPAPRSSRELATLFGLVTPVTECVRTQRAADAQARRSTTATSRPARRVYRELLHALVGLASASQNFDGNGPAVRYHAGFGDQLGLARPAARRGEALVGLDARADPRLAAEVAGREAAVPARRAVHHAGAAEPEGRDRPGAASSEARGSTPRR